MEIYIQSFMDEPVTYQKSTGNVTLRPNTVTKIDSSIVSAQELIDCYGQRIAVISNELVEAENLMEEPETKEEKEKIIEELFTNPNSIGDELGKEAEEVPVLTEEKKDEKVSEPEEIKEETKEDTKEEIKEESSKNKKGKNSKFNSNKTKAKG